ncbi:Hypothetical protein, putative [Bodo saltans]|uniref:Uncharacterized protein n=1 Tax=Bodo saltans TaxID=75058 RepID=A0A0S4IKL5_BODSA|nr:Hypothetical protein, putative [Bodo saltans]|eukprot:CUE66346.1 Hypothetical protein, putative [Bodo saltans]
MSRAVTHTRKGRPDWASNTTITNNNNNNKTRSKLASGKRKEKKIMMRRTPSLRIDYRPNYNLASKTPGRAMTGFMTPYRHWMWKQNELWRNVHEAQFEHLRKVYRRQWLESFRVNADEYIYKYNITKAAQYAQWEHEMHDQEAKRRETLELNQGRQQLKAKHMDLLREYHERHFFYWYERASERLQYMTKIKYIKADQLDAHIDAELDKYVAGKSQGYPLNFVGQLPMLEDNDGNVIEVPADLMTSHNAEHPESGAKVFQPPSLASDEKLRNLITGLDEIELTLNDADTSAMSTAINDIAKEEDADEGDKKVAFSVEQTDDDRAIAKQKYIQRGNVGSKSVYRRARSTDGTDSGSAGPAGPSGPSSKSPMKRQKIDETKRKSMAKDAEVAMKVKKYMKDGTAGTPEVKVGEIRSQIGRLKDRVANLPSMEEVLAIPQMRDANVLSQPKTQGIIDKAFGRNKRKGGDEQL